MGIVLIQEYVLLYGFKLTEFLIKRLPIQSVVGGEVHLLGIIDLIPIHKVEPPGEPLLFRVFF